MVGTIDITRVDLEFNHGWINENPVQFAASVMQFHVAHPIEEWSHRICMASRFRIKLIAIRRKEPYVFERDYLREIGMEI